MVTVVETLRPLPMLLSVLVAAERWEAADGGDIGGDADGSVDPLPLLLYVTVGAGWWR